MQAQAVVADVFARPEAVLAHWQGHRRLTRRVLEAYPEDQLFTFSVGGMRPFGELVLEFLMMGVPMLRELAGEAGGAYGDAAWVEEVKRATSPKAELLRVWDEQTSQVDELWHKLPPEIFQETRKVFGQYEGPVNDLLLYVIDNEIHHRGQGYVYLRALGLEPPHFWERG